MAQFDNTTELSLKNEGISSPTELSGTSGDGKSRAKSSNADSTDSKGYRKKKEDALEGKETKEARGESDSDDEGHHAADKAEADDSGTHSRQGLQSGQTTVQFSSGGGVGGGNANMASSLGSLLGLFASSASLVRAEGGVALNVANQSVNLTLRAAFQASNNQIGSFLNEEGRLKGNVEAGAGQASESASGKFNPDTGGSTTSHSGGNISQGISSGLLTSVSAQGAEGGTDQGSSNTITVISSIGTTVIYTPTFNAGSIFNTATTPFAFPNSAISGSTGSTGTGSPLAPYSGVAGAYLEGAAQAGGFSLAPTSTYSYQLLSPLAIPPGSSGASSVFTSGVTFTPITTPTFTSLTLNASAAPATPITTSTDGLTLTASGDLYVNVTTPVSVYVDILSPGNPAIPVRIDAGPSDGLPSVTAPNDTALPNRMIGNFANGAFQDTVFVNSSITAAYTIIGTDADLNIGSSGTGSTLSRSFSLSSLPSSGIFPSNTIYEHVGTTGTTPLEVAYGNFANAGFSGGGTIDLPSGPASYNLTMGGNVLDVYGTKYGVADTLDVVLPASGTATNSLTMGGNTLAGFGTSYGDLQNLTISAQSGNSPTTVGTTDLMFRGNDLAVDKDVSSTLYPHLQTLDMEQATSTGIPSSLIAPANVKITFQDSIIQGNAISTTTQGSTGTGGSPGDVFYGDIQNLSNSSSTSYNGFLIGVNVTDVGGQVMTTTSDGNNNSITWGNDIYTGGALNPTDPTVVANNTYNFTLLLDGATQQAVMQGNALITNANLNTDTYNFQISPALFRALDGADNLGHDKVLTTADLNASATFSTLSQSSVQSIDPLFGQYLSENGLGAATGTTITFDNVPGVSNGGSISLVGLTSPLTSFAGIPYTLDVTFTYAPVAAIPAPQIVAANPTQIIATTPTEGLFLYAKGPDVQGQVVAGPYYNELDNFFDNSLYATYSIATGPINGVTTPIIPTTPDSLTPGDPTAVQYDIAPGVIIDQFGTINVTSTVPILTPLTITATSIDSATHQTSTAPTTQFFGFLDAPKTTIVDQGTTVNSPTFHTSSNILIGGVDSTLAGEPNLSGGSTDALSLSTAPGGTPGTPMIGQTLPTFGSNLIVDVKGGATVYGDFQDINFTADGAVLPGVPGAANVLGAINQNIFNFAANAFYVLNGAAIYGVGQTFDVMAQGGQNDNVSVAYGSGLSPFNAAAEFNGNTFTFGPQTIYGSGPTGTGTPVPIYGNFQDFNISAVAGSGATLSEAGTAGIFGSIPPGSAFLDLSSQVEGNKFTFGDVQITVEGDAAADTTILYPNLQDLSVTVEPGSPNSSNGNLSLVTTATFSGNQFIFGNATLTGGAGNTVFNADVNLNDNTSPFAYTGFINGVTTSLNSAGQLVTTDANNNSIAWGKDTLTGGQGINIYNFTLLYNSAPGPVTEQSTPNGLGGNVVTVTDPAAVFTGVDEITNLNLTGNATTTDQLVFTLEPNLYVEMAPLLAISGQASPLSLLDLVSTFTHTAPTLGDPNGNTIITFDAPSGGNNGTLTLDNVYITNFGELESFFPGSLVINVANVNPTLNANAVFDPVFVNGSQPGVFSNFITNPSGSTLTYTPISSSNGITLGSDGTLTVSVSGIVDMSLTGIAATTASGEVIPLPAVHIFALGDSNATSVDVDTTSSFISGSPGAAAYEVTAGTVFGGGGSIDLENNSLTYGSHLIDDTSTTTHAIYGDVVNIFNDSSTSITGQTFAFDPNLMNINIGTSSADQTFGVLKSLSISVSGASNGPDTPFSSNDFIFGTFGSSPNNSIPSNILDNTGKGSYIYGNTLYGSGSLEGTVQTITLSDSSSDTNSTIDGDRFYFGGNSLTNGAYLNGTNTLTSSSGTDLYANATTLTITGTAINQITNNSFIFADDTLNGGSASTNFFGHLSNFSDFYNGVTVTKTTTSGETFLSIDDNNENLVNNSNVITWGNDTYTGGTTGNNTYNFTIVGDTLSRPVMQGFDTITNFNLTSDKLVFSLPNALYTSLAGTGNILTPTAFLNDLTLQGSTLLFSGGGSITLSGLSSQNLSTLASDITIVTTSPGAVIQSPTSTVVVFGNTANADTWSNLFNTTDPLAATLPNGITFNANVSETVTGFGNNTGIINTTVPTVVVNDFGTNLISDTSAANPVQILGLNGMLIYLPIGTPEQGGIEADVFIGHGNVITGGGADLQYGAAITAPSGTYALVNPLPSDYTTATAASSTTVTNPTTAESTYASKLIYDVAPAPTNPVTGDVQNITASVQSLSGIIFNSAGGGVDGSGTLTGATITMANNYIQVVPSSSGTNFDAQQTYGNDQTIFLIATGGENVYNVTTSTDDAKIHNNSITTSGNTIIAPGVVYGADQAISLTATDGFYATQTPAPSTAPENLAVISGNNFMIGNNTITETGTGTDIAYGVSQSISLQIAPAVTSLESAAFTAALPGSSGLETGNSQIKNNMFDFGQNTLTGGQGTSSLYAGVGQLVIEDNAPTSTTQPTPSEITGNTFVFQDSTLTATSGTTNFYDDVADLSKTNFSAYGVSATNVGGFVQVTDVAGTGLLTANDSTVSGNVITFGNDMMTASTTAGSTNIFNLTLMVTANGNIVAEGDTIINNFEAPGAPNTNMLNLQLTQALYDDILTANGITPSSTAVPITGVMMDSYLAAHNGTITDTGGNAVISFSNGSGSNDNFGSINLPGVTLPDTYLLDLGTNLEITADGITTVDSYGTLIDQPIGTPEQGGTEADAFIGHGNIITGGGADLQYGASITPSGAYVLTDPLPPSYLTATAASGTTVTNPSTAESTYASKLIYDVAPTPTNPVTGDVQNITDTVQSLSGAIFNGGSADGSVALTGATITMASNFIDVVPASSGTNFDAQETYGNGQTVSFSATGGENVYNVTTSTDDAKIQGNSVTAGNNTIIAPGTVYGADQAISLTATDGFYATQTPAPSTAPKNLAEVSGNNFTVGNTTITETGTGTDIAYGVSGSITLQVAPADTALESPAFTAALPTSSGLEIGNSQVNSNVFDFGETDLTGGQGTSSLYAGVGQLIIENNEPASMPGTQPAPSQITGNDFVFQDSTLTATSGTTNFYDDVANLESTNFSDYAVSATNVGGHVQVTDVAGTGLLTANDSTVSGNIITFADETMTGSTAAGSTNIFNLNLMVTAGGSIVAEGDTTINNFGAPGAPNTNMLNLQLSQALYNDILTANSLPTGGAAVPITGAMLDSYLAAHNGSITETNGNAVISFSDGSGSNNNFGSITVDGVTLSTDHISNLGTNLEITADGITTIDPPPSPSNVYNIDIPGNTAASYAQDTHIIDVSSLGHIVDFAGTVDLNMSNALFKAAGLSDSNTAAQNLQTLENDAHTAAGGIAVSTTTTGTGANVITNTILTFEATTNGVINTYGSVTLHNTHFNPADPLSAHLTVTHH